jgi:hypothetical protein
MKALKINEFAPSGSSANQSSHSLRRRPVPWFPTSWHVAARDLAVAALITIAWLLVVGLGVAFWTAVIWWAAR